MVGVRVNRNRNPSFVLILSFPVLTGNGDTSGESLSTLRG